MKQEIVYKLTDQNGYTRNNTLWGVGVTHTASGAGELCSNGWLHAYSHPLLAVLLNPVHARIENPLLWKALGKGHKKDDNGLKCGFSSLQTLEELPLPVVSTTQRVAFGILCALKSWPSPSFVRWAEGWLRGDDRGRAAAASAAHDANAVTVYAANAAVAADAVYAANATAAAYATYAAASAAAHASRGIDFIAIAEEAMKY